MLKVADTAIKTRVTSEMKTEFEKAAQSKNLSLSDWARECMIANLPSESAKRARRYSVKGVGRPKKKKAGVKSNKTTDAMTDIVAGVL